MTSHDIFSSEAHSIQDISLATQAFFEKIHEHVRCQQLHYIFPDGVEEFSLSSVRQQINLCFPDARPLPRSIGAVFDFLHANPDAFLNYKRVLVLVVSILGTQLVVTPLIGQKDEEIQKKIPSNRAPGEKMAGRRRAPADIAQYASAMEPCLSDCNHALLRTACV